MDKKELQIKLSQAYSTENWQQIVDFVFPNVSLRDKPAILAVETRFQDIVESFKQLGDVILHDGKKLALLELKVKENVNLIRNRVRLNEVVSSVIDTENANGVLSIFEKGTDDYRFTFSARGSEFDDEEGDFITTKTDTKRFTYVLGKNESCKTPAQRFYELSENKNKAEIKDIENAFSVEKLSKAFFKEYKDQYTAFVNYMMQTPSIFKAIYSEDDKAIRDFVKILLGRIIFIKFVQKKGWMGVDGSSKKWVDGDYRFLENGFANFKHQDLFYSTFLEPLFDALDQPNRANDIFSVTNTRVPYLSGGLFELEDKKTKNINFPAKYFNDLFEFLDRYNFTIDENDTNDHEVGIDPEMLGHIFENLLEDNKDKGAFYTPKEIVRYMCQESLKEYLKTSLENNKQWPADVTEATEFEQALHNFVTKKEAGGIIEFEETIARALKDVKICDPAIGSGAFPMGLLNEIFQLVHKLHEDSGDKKYKIEQIWELKSWQPNKVKQNIIQNSIYGVDIEKGAVDVARLRFWLSLIVDEPEPKALPHLDYKIVVGNSLVSKLDDTIIDIDWDVKEEQTDLFGNENKERQQQLLKEISAKQKLVFDPNSDEEKLSLQIRNLKIDLLVNQLDAMVKTKGVATKPTGTSKTIKAQTELWLQTLGWKQQIEKLQKLKKDTNGMLHFFDWKLDFPEIMNEQVTDKVGFDIVIGNPPYLLIAKDTFLETYKTYSLQEGKIDLYRLFMEKSVSLTKNKGTFSFIIPNTILTIPSCKLLREHFLNFHKINSIINFENDVFKNASVNSIIFSSNKNSNSKSNNILIHSSAQVSDLINFKFQLIPQEHFLKNIKSEFNIFMNNVEDSIIKKIEKVSGNLKDLGYEVSLGAQIYHNTIHNKKQIETRFLHSPLLINSKFKIELGGRKILPFKVNLDGEYVDYSKEFYTKPADKFFFGPKVILREITGKKLIAAFSDENFIVNKSCYSIVHENLLFLKFILAILNSNLIAFIINKTGDKSKQKLFPRISMNAIQNIPVIIPKKLNELVSVVDTIINLKLKNEDTYNLEQQIDNLVYKLYELTYDEVLVVEPEFSERMSRLEYEGLKIE